MVAFCVPGPKIVGAGEVGADGVFADHGSGVGGIAEDRDREWESGLHLVFHRAAPVACDGASQIVPSPRFWTVDRAQRKAAADVAAQAFLSIQVVVVLRSSRLEHGRAEIRRVLERLSERVVGEKAQAVGVTAAHIHVPRVVPALRCVLKQVDGADRKRSVEGWRFSDGGRKGAVGDEADPRMRTARLNEPRPGLRIVDEVRPLQMKSARAEVTHFKRCFAAQLLFERSAPLLDVLRRVRAVEGR